MAFEAFLKIDGIAGESTDKIHPGEIEVESFSWGETQTATVGGGGGGGTGKVIPQDFHFTAGLSKASPNLMLACATGRHFPTATLSVRTTDSSHFEFAKIRLSDLLVSSYQTGGEAGGEEAVPTDQFSLAFLKIDFFYTVAKTGEMVETTFDFGALI
jgi:type VI secretion system secreted protein Hcp